MRLRLGSALSLVCLSAVFSFTWYAARSGNEGTGLDVYQSQFLELRQRLLFAEKENRKRSHELNSVLNEIKRVVGERTNTSTNVTDSTKWKVLSVSNRLPVRLTNIQYYLPHLQEHEDGIYPNVVIGQGRTGVSLVMGIPTVRREKQTYLMDTLNSLFYEMSAKQKNDCVIVIFVAEIMFSICAHIIFPDITIEYKKHFFRKEYEIRCRTCGPEETVIIVPIELSALDGYMQLSQRLHYFMQKVDSEYVNIIAEKIKSSFPNEVFSGVLEVISPPASYYPQLSNLKETFGDSKDRVRWRTKQNLDYSFLMLYAQPKGTFYLQLEDDIIAKPEYIEIIKDFAEQQASNDWMILEFSQLGFIGKLFRSRDLPLIVEFFLMFYKDKPIDWLLDHLLWVKVCNPERDAKHCERQKAYLRISYKPSLFQHVGIHSSLAGKIQNLKDKDFGKNQLFKAHINPPAEVSTSLKVFQHFTLEKAYKGTDCFWAFAPVAGDYILFSFFQPLKIERYLFKSGNMEHPGDKLFNTTVEVFPADDLQPVEDNAQNFEKTQDGYLQIGAFENGVADGIINPSIGKIYALRLSIHSSSPVWALLSEIFLKT